MLNDLRSIACGLALTVAFAVILPCPVAALADESQPAGTAPAAGVGVTMQTTARVVKIDPATNTVTLRGPRGNLADIEVDPKVGDVKRLAVGDRVHIEYRAALLLAAEKTDSNGIRSRVETRMVAPASGGTAGAANHIEVVATVQKVDVEKRQVTLRGPRRTVVLEVGPDVPLERLHVGESIRAEYINAVAVHVTRDSGTTQ